MPVMEDLYNCILQQDEPEAKHIATALEIYVKGSLNVFNHRTNVDINNRIICFDIKELGKQLKKIGMLVTQDKVWNRVTVNRQEHKSTSPGDDAVEKRKMEIRKDSAERKASDKRSSMKKRLLERQRQVAQQSPPKESKPKHEVREL